MKYCFSFSDVIEKLAIAYNNCSVKSDGFLTFSFINNKINSHNVPTANIFYNNIMVKFSKSEINFPAKKTLW